MSGAADVMFDTLLTTVKEIGVDFVAHLPLLLAGAIALLFTWAAVALLRRMSDRLLQRTGLRGSLRELIQRLMVIAAWGLGLMLAAMIVFPGLTPARALGGLGLLSVAIGFAFRDIFENFFAGILILWRFPFERGDYIECQDIVGRVEDVTVRMTQIRRSTGELVVLPNGFLFKNPVEVLTHERNRRMSIVAGVAYGEDLGAAVEIIEKAVAACDSVASDPPPEIYPQAFGASSVDIEVSWWTDAKPGAMRRSRAEVVVAIKRALDEAGIEIPFPYRTLTFKQPLPVVPAESEAA